MVIKDLYHLPWVLAVIKGSCSANSQSSLYGYCILIVTYELTFRDSNSRAIEGVSG